MKPILLTLDTRRVITSKLELMQGYDYILQCFLNDDGSRIDLEESKIQIELLKADNTFIIQTENIEVDRNKITFEIDKDFLRVAGEGKLQIVATKEGKTFGSWIVDINVNQRAISDNKGQSQSKVTITEELKSTITEAQEVKDEIIKDISDTGEKEKTELNEVVEKAEVKENALKELIEYNEENRVKVWTPSVDPDGNLSWEQGKAETEPPAKQNIKGDKGEKGQDGKQGERGLRGDRGEKGKDATINGFNTLEIEKGENIEIKQEDNKLIISSTASGNADINDDVVSKESTWSSEKIEDFGLKNSGTDWKDIKGNNVTVDFSKEGHLRDVEIVGSGSGVSEIIIDTCGENLFNGELIQGVEERLESDFIKIPSTEWITFMLPNYKKNEGYIYLRYTEYNAKKIKINQEQVIGDNYKRVSRQINRETKYIKIAVEGELKERKIEITIGQESPIMQNSPNLKPIGYNFLNKKISLPIKEKIFIPTYKDKTHIFVTGGEIKAKAPVDLGKAVRTLKEENEKILEGYTELKEFLSVVYSNLSEKGMLDGIPNTLI